MLKRYCCVHGHFYQPPRENPWIEIVERQPSARPEHDWNRRIARECYIPNGYARILEGAGGRIARIVDNYEYLSFNFGPTLLSWFEKAFPHDYRRLIEADQASCRRLGGHGNALAQAYNHMILTLASPRDLLTQIRWGLADFRHRFGRKPEAMWLPETACNDAVLKALIEHGLEYVLLAPSQALRVRAIGAQQWYDVSNGSVDTRRAYRWSAPGSDGGKSIALFFYDAGLSQGVAFEKVMADSKSWADRIAAAFDPVPPVGTAPGVPQLVSLCTDGESYGHHEHFGEMGLASLLARELPERGVEVVNYGFFLAENPPQWEAEIKPGPDGLGTSWSCSHGVSRWTDACGCGAEGRQLGWRRPMREALDWLRDHLAQLYEREGERLFKDAWQARDAYIAIVLDRREETLAAFMADHLKVPDAPEARQKALRLLEMQRHAMLMYTSCGWFFSDISGIEAVQNLQYAARAVELAREAAGVDLEGGLTARLRLAPGNHPKFKDGEIVYHELASAGRVGEDLAVAHAAVSLLFCAPASARPLGHFETLACETARGEAADARLCAGRITLRSGLTAAPFSRVFLAAALPDCAVKVFVRPADLPPEQFDGLAGRVRAQTPAAASDLAALAGGIFATPPFGFSDLRADERERILACVVETSRAVWEASPPLSLGECLSLVEQHSQLGLDLPAGLRGQADAALDALLHRRAREFLERPDDDLAGVSGAVARAKAVGLAPASASAENAWEKCFAMVLAGLEREVSAVWLRRLAALVRAAKEMGLTRWRFRTQNRFFALLERLPAQGEERVRLAGEIDEAARLLEIAADAV